MTDYVVTAELDGPEFTDDDAEGTLDHLDNFAAATGVAPTGCPSVTVTLRAEDLRIAVNTALGLIREATGRNAVAVSAMAEAERDVRGGIVV